MTDQSQTRRHDLIAYQAAYVCLDNERDNALLDVIEDYYYASGERCMFINVDFALGVLLDEQQTLTPGERTLLQLCQQAEREQYDDILIYVD